MVTTAEETPPMPIQRAFRCPHVGLAIAALILMGGVGASAQAQIVVLDFEEPDVAASETILLPFTEDGFTLTIDEPPPEGLAIVEDDSSFFTGSQSAVLSFVDISLTITIDDPGSNFVPVSIDIADLASFGPLSIPFTGTTVDGDTVSETLVTDGIVNFGSLDTLDFSITETLTSLTFTNVSPGFIFDNITLLVVPEPSTATIGLIAITGIAGRRTRRSC